MKLISMGVVDIPGLLQQQQQEEWLRSIFRLCDPHNRGWIDIRDLIALGFETGVDEPETQAVRDLLSLLDPLGDGCLTFDKFSMGFNSLMDTSAGSMTSSLRLQSTDSLRPTGSQFGLSIEGAMEIEEKMDNPNTVFTNGFSRREGEGGKNVWKTNSNGIKPESLHLQDEDIDSGLSKSTSPDSHPPGNNSQCSSMSEREVSFECYGEADEVDNVQVNLSDMDTSSGTRFGNSSLSTLDLAQRNTWMRNSLRRNHSSASDGLGKRWGSFRHPGKRVASTALTSFNSSGRSCNGETEEVYSDVSLEDVNDISQKLETLQQQVAAIADNRTNTDERYSRTKQENAALNVRIQMLEESFRDMELRAEQRLTEEQKRHRELIVRVERERQLEVENYTIRLQAAEKELHSVREEATRLRSQTERLRSERNALQDRLSDLEAVLEETKLELRRSSELARREREDYALERANAKQAHTDLNQEIDTLKILLNTAKPPSVSLARSPSVSDNSPQASRIREMELEIRALRQEKLNIQETNEDLQAQLLTHGLEEGRVLLTGTDNSLAAEFEAMGQDDVRKALREQQEVNAQLRSYIEGILLNIVENQPQLLERKQGEK